MTARGDRPSETAQEWLHCAEGDLAVAEPYPGDIAAEQIGAEEAKEALEAAQKIRARVHGAMAAES